MNLLVPVILLLATLPLSLAAEPQQPKAPLPIEALIDALKATDPQISVSAAEALGRVSGPRAIYALLLALGDPRPAVAFAAAGALNTRHEVEPDSRIPAAFVSALGNGNVHVVAGAHRFFVRRGGGDAEVALVQALELYGHVEMARDFLNCGNARLAAAARQWAIRTGHGASSLTSRVPAVRWRSR